MGCKPSVVITTSSKNGQSTTVVRRCPLRNRVHSSSSWSGPVTLTEKEKKLVARTMYNIRPKLSEVGIKVFHTIFSIQPELKNLFGFKDKKDEDLDYDMDFRNHAARFMAVVGCAIESLSDSSQLSDLYYRLGAQHLHVQGFQSKNFTVFKEALLICMAEHSCDKDKFKGEVYLAWDNVVNYIIQHLQQGYLDASGQQEDSSVHHPDPPTQQRHDTALEDPLSSDVFTNSVPAGRGKRHHPAGFVQVTVAAQVCKEDAQVMEKNQRIY